jgi:MarC family integral membrane protein
VKNEIGLFVSTFTTLLAIINPFEVLPVFLKLLEGKDTVEHRRVVEDAALTRALNGRASGGPVRTVKRGQSLKVSRSCSLLAGVNGRLVKEKATGSELASQAGFGGGTFR